MHQHKVMAEGDFGTGTFKPYIIHERVHKSKLNVYKMMENLIEVSHKQAMANKELTQTYGNKNN